MRVPVNIRDSYAWIAGEHVVELCRPYVLNFPIDQAIDLNVRMISRGDGLILLGAYSHKDFRAPQAA